MADSESRLFVSLVLFWTFLTIFSFVFSSYLDGEQLGTDIRNFVPDGNDAQIDLQQSWWERFVSGIYDTLEDVPIINVFIPLAKLLTFGYSSQIHPIITIFLQATLIFTYYVVFRTFKK